MAKTVLNINNYEKILASFYSYESYKKSCQNILYDKQVWKEVELVNTRISYEYYLQTFPSGFYIGEAKKRIIKVNSEDNKSWERAKKENKKYSYENYLKDYPDGLNAQEAKTRIMDINAWERAKSYNTKESYEDYLENYPNGLFKIEAKKIVDEHETWETAKANNSKSLYRDYLRKYPNGIYSYQANTLIAQILAKEKKDFWQFIKYTVIAVIIVLIFRCSDKENDNKSVSNQQSEPVVDITLRNDNCWDSDYYANDKLVAKVSAHSLVNFKINPGTYTTKACTPGTSNCGSLGNSVWTKPTTATINPHPDCVKQQENLTQVEKPNSNTTPIILTPTDNNQSLYVNTEQMILRAGAGADYGELGRVFMGDTVVATETAVNADGGNWVKVKTGNLEGWLNRKLLSTSQPSEKEANLSTQPIVPSFDCTKASTDSEHLICSNANLAAKDVEISKIYSKVLKNTTDKAALKLEQNQWRKTNRDACTEVDCILNTYAVRIRQLNELDKKNITNQPVSNTAPDTVSAKIINNQYLMQILLNNTEIVFKDNTPQNNCNQSQFSWKNYESSSIRKIKQGKVIIVQTEGATNIKQYVNGSFDFLKNQVIAKNIGRASLELQFWTVNSCNITYAILFDVIP